MSDFSQEQHDRDVDHFEAGYAAAKRELAVQCIVDPADLHILIQWGSAIRGLDGQQFSPDERMLLARLRAMRESTAALS